MSYSTTTSSLRVRNITLWLLLLVTSTSTPPSFAEVVNLPIYWVTGSRSNSFLLPFSFPGSMAPPSCSDSQQPASSPTVEVARRNSQAFLGALPSGRLGIVFQNRVRSISHCVPST